MEHTPTPWKLGTPYEGKVKIFHDSKRGFSDDHDTVANSIPEVDAAFIVTAANAYEKDQEIIGELIGEIKRIHPIIHGSNCSCSGFKSLLAKAESR